MDPLDLAENDVFMSKEILTNFNSEEKKILNAIEDGLVCDYREVETLDDLLALFSFFEKSAPLSSLTMTIFWIRESCHAVLLIEREFSSLYLYNPNHAYHVNVPHTFETNDVDTEPSLEEYEYFWKKLNMTPIFENDQNCVIWCAMLADGLREGTVSIDSFLAKKKLKLLAELEKFGEAILKRINSK